MKTYNLLTIKDSEKALKEIDRNLRCDLTIAIRIYLTTNELEPASKRMCKINTDISQWLNSRQKCINLSYSMLKSKEDLNILNSILEMSVELKELYTQYQELIANRKKLRSDEKYKKSKIKKTVNTLETIKANIDKLNSADLDVINSVILALLNNPSNVK